MTTSNTTAAPRKGETGKLGRSAVTGHTVLRPATTTGRSTSKEAIRDAVLSVTGRRD